MQDRVDHPIGEEAEARDPGDDAQQETEATVSPAEEGEQREPQQIALAVLEEQQHDREKADGEAHALEVGAGLRPDAEKGGDMSLRAEIDAGAER